MYNFLNVIWAPVWAFIQPYIVPAMAWLAGDSYRSQLEHIKQLEADNACKDKENASLTAALGASSDVIGLSKQAALDELERRGVQDVSGKPRKKR